MNTNIRSIVECLERNEESKILKKCLDISSLLSYLSESYRTSINKNQMGGALDLYLYLVEEEYLEGGKWHIDCMFGENHVHNIWSYFEDRGYDPDEICFKSALSRDKLVDEIFTNLSDMEMIDYVAVELAKKYNYKFTQTYTDKILSLFHDKISIITMVLGCNLVVKFDILDNLLNNYHIKKFNTSLTLSILRYMLNVDYCNIRIIRKLLEQNQEKIIEKIDANFYGTITNTKIFKFINTIGMSHLLNGTSEIHFMNFKPLYIVCNHLAISLRYNVGDVHEIIRKRASNFLSFLARKNKFKVTDRKDELQYNLVSRISSKFSSKNLTKLASYFV